MAHAGLLSWANSVRLTMASDPGRQAFKDQVQTIGFLFLDDYLDNIVSGAKQDPLIELVKTPGRKRAFSNKIKLGPSKLNSVLAVESDQDGENICLSNDFNKSLFGVKEEHSKKREAVKISEISEKPQRTPLNSIQPIDNNIVPPRAPMQPTPTTPPVQLPPVAATTQLSVIAEDEEPLERSHPAASGLGQEMAKFPPVPEPSIRHALVGETPNTSRRESKASVLDVDTFHSIPLDSPLASGMHGVDSSLLQTSVSNKEMVIDNDTVPTSNDLQNHGMEDIQEDTKMAEKLLSSFPTLPEPMPLRKSTRFRDPSINTVMLGAATPGAAPGKRTSWLAKAREVKALEVHGKKTDVHPLHGLNSTVTALSLPQGTKRKSGEVLIQDSNQEEERAMKVAKTVEGETAPRKSKEKVPLSPNVQEPSEWPLSAHVDERRTSQEGVLDMLKKTVEGLGVRVGKTMSKSIGGDAANALAEAKAAAEARLAERDRHEETTLGVSELGLVNLTTLSQDVDLLTSTSNQQDNRRMSVSDLFPRDRGVKEKHKVPEKVFHKVTTTASPFPDIETSRMRTSTTPPESSLPPIGNPTHTVASVFTKLIPVFVPPVQTTSKSTGPVSNNFGFEPSSLFKHVIPSPTSQDLSVPLSYPKGEAPAAPLTTQSTIESIQSEAIFDQDDASAWMPSTQDTEYTSAYGSQPQPQTEICDEDDSWPVDEKLAAGVQWTYGMSKEDSMTWSTLPSESQRADIGPVTRTSPTREEGVLEPERSRQIPAEIDIDMGNEEDLIPRDKELEKIVLVSQSTVNLVKQPDPSRSQSQMSMASLESSQSHTGFFGQASKFLSNALGTGKKKPEVKKVLQMAAVAAKKQQEEADKKAARLKEMDMRRQQAIQRKAEEEKVKALEEERKMKEEVERRKREREEQTDKRPFKPLSSKREDEAKKKKVESASQEKKPKPAPSVLLGKSHLKHALKQPTAFSTTDVNSIHSTESSRQVQIASTPLQKKAQVLQKQAIEDDFTQPSHMLQSQMAARAKAKLEASKPTIPSESIELPDINSEYSDSEDEDRPRKYEPPEWAQSPELRLALEQQSTINPDNIFGAVRPLKMEELFKTKTSRFRARTSSANWTGSDRLTVQEELEYARRMGFK